MQGRSRPRVRGGSKVETQRVAAEPVPERPEHTSLAMAESYSQEAVRPQAEGNRDPALGMEGVYIISVAARILDMHPQTLRKYERLGLINPGRTLGMLRLYSAEDILKVRLIQRLSNMGLNLAGIEFALSTAENLHRLNRRLQSLAGNTQTINAIKSEIGAVLQSLNLSVNG